MGRALCRPGLRDLHALIAPSAAWSLVVANASRSRGCARVGDWRHAGRGRCSGGRGPASIDVAQECLWSFQARHPHLLDGRIRRRFESLFVRVYVFFCCVFFSLSPRCLTTSLPCFRTCPTKALAAAAGPMFLLLTNAPNKCSAVAVLRGAFQRFKNASHVTGCLGLSFLGWLVCLTKSRVFRRVSDSTDQTPEVATALG